MNDPHDNAADDKAMLEVLKAIPPAPARDVKMYGYSTETRNLINRAIELNPAMEEAILLIAECAYADGQDEQHY